MTISQLLQLHSSCPHTVPGPPDAPVNVTIESVTSTTVSISWTAPTSGDIRRYDIELSEKVFGLSTVKKSTTETYITVTGLEEYNTYGCRVAAVSRSDIGTFSSLVNFTTLEAGRSAFHKGIIIL